MCGVAGVLNLDGAPVSPVVLRRMMNAIAHRGPDGEGSWIEGAIGLGHRRLAIIDLTAAGHQPMQTAGGRYVLSYNGEIYNFRELRVELQAKGYRFRSRTDTEVLLYALSEWGSGALDRLNGMFAFALWDRVEKRLTLARDRYGIKPLYYCATARSLLFASEVKAFLPHPDFHARINPQALVEYFTFQNLFTDGTLFRDVRVVPAGSCLTLSAVSSEQLKTTKYWDFQFTEPEQSRSEDSYIEELDKLLQQAITRQLVSDVKVGTYLSGGMDSGAIATIAARRLARMRTFTCGFDLDSASGTELDFDERAAARNIAGVLNTEHHEIVLKAEDIERAMPLLVWHLEEPRLGQSYPNFYAAKLAGTFNKVVLAGTGGDEIFGGYPWRYFRPTENQDFTHYADLSYAYWQRLIPASMTQAVFRPIWSEVSHLSTRDIFRSAFAGSRNKPTRPEDYINQSLYFEAKTFLHGLLVVEDKLSMAHSLESRVPFLDNDLVDFAMKLPIRFKLHDPAESVASGTRRNGPLPSRTVNEGKLLLRRTMARYLPQKIIERRKQGFSGPDASWFRNEASGYVRSSLDPKHAKLWSYLDQRAMRPLIDEHLSGRQNRRLLIWSLLYFEEFLKARWQASADDVFSSAEISAIPSVLSGCVKREARAN
jgi:asparagine synthase (glutamine-hydrolysing)